MTKCETRVMGKNWKVFISVLLLCAVTVWLTALSTNDNLKIVTCDVGQGDASLLIYKNYEILIDGGPNNKVSDCLSRNMPFWDRTIEVVILTHPQKDHFFGLIKVFEDYKVELLLANEIDSGSTDYRVLKDTVGGTTTKVVSPATGDRYRLDLIYLDILNPSEEFLAKNSVPENSEEAGVLGSTTSSLDPNELSIVAQIRFGNFKALFTGDIGPEKSDEVASVLEEKNDLPINYIKIPHHGSKNGMSVNLLRITHPTIAVISVGKGNSYGHPSPEIIRFLESFGVKILRTDQMGDIVVETDGERVWLKK